MSDLFACIQLEFARPLGPSEGRYVVRCEAPGATGADVLDVRAAAARVIAESRAGRRRRQRWETDHVAAALSLLRYTLIRAATPIAATDACAWLASLRADAGLRARETDRAFEVLNTAIRAYRVAAGDPYAVEVTEADALTIRFGAGTAREVFDGDDLVWLTRRQGGAQGADADIAPDRLGPTVAVADALAGRAGPRAADDLILRALLDLRHANPVGAAGLLVAAAEVIAADGGCHIDADDELLVRTRSAARLALSGEDLRPTLRAVAVELRERLQVAVPQQRHVERSSTMNDSPILAGYIAGATS